MAPVFLPAMHVLMSLLAIHGTGVFAGDGCTGVFVDDARALVSLLAMHTPASLQAMQATDVFADNARRVPTPLLATLMAMDVTNS